jgi:hypothetical protein
MTYPSCLLWSGCILTLAGEENASIAKVQLSSILYLTVKSTLISLEVSYVILP